MEFTEEGADWLEEFCGEYASEIVVAVERLSKVIDVLTGAVRNEFVFVVTERSDDTEVRSLRWYLVHGVRVDHDESDYSGYELLTEEAAHLALNIVPKKDRDERLDHVAEHLLDRAIEQKNESFCLRQAAAAKA